MDDGQFQDSAAEPYGRQEAIGFLRLEGADAASHQEERSRQQSDRAHLHFAFQFSKLEPSEVPGGRLQQQCDEGRTRREVPR